MAWLALAATRPTEIARHAPPPLMPAWTQKNNRMRRAPPPRTGPSTETLASRAAEYLEHGTTLEKG